MPTKIVYTGPFAAGVEIADTGQWAEPGKPVEVDSELAERLLEQDVWARPTAKAAAEAGKQARRTKRAEGTVLSEAPPTTDTVPEENS